MYYGLLPAGIVDLSGCGQLGTQLSRLDGAQESTQSYALHCAAVKVKLYSVQPNRESFSTSAAASK